MKKKMSFSNVALENDIFFSKLIILIIRKKNAIFL
jgi:hypothetical protein